MIGDDGVVLHQYVNAPDESINWHERCIHLELLLQRLRLQSNKLRNAFLNRISELEIKLKDAESKANDTSETLINIMQSQTDASDLRQDRDELSCSSPELVQLQQAMEEKEKVINQLELKIEEQKKMRLNDAMRVEMKAAKIKEWVSNKLKELEEQNQYLREENRKCSDELKTLRKRLEFASPETKRKIENAIKYYYERDAKHVFDIDFLKNSQTDNSLWKNTKKENSLNFSSSSEDESNIQSMSANIKALRSSRQRKPIPPPRTRIPIPNNNTRVVGTPQLPIRHGPFMSSSFTRGGSLDRKLADMKKLNFSELRKKRMGTAATDEFNDYSEIYTPNREVKEFSNFDVTKRPPTPPLHRCPSWESRLYKVATASVKSATSTPTHSIRSNFRSEENAFSHDDSEAAFHMNVPVFATVQGRASQIRSIPFSGDSSDSSDNETDGRITTTTGTTSSSGHSDSDFFATPKGFRRNLSIESQLSSDYAVPPDAVMSNSHNGFSANEFSDPKTPKRFSSLQKQLSPLRNKEMLEKSGYLTKLGGKLKTWRRRWFVLKDGVLYYYRAQNEVNRCKPRGHITLNKNCRVSMAGGSATFQIITGNNKKVYYLSADSVITMEEWIRIIQYALKRNAIFCSRDDVTPTIEGSLIKVKRGHAKKCWCSLICRNLVYFKSSNDTIPMGQIDLKGAKVKESHYSDSDNDDSPTNTGTDEGKSVVNTDSKYTIAIFLKDKVDDPTYLLLSNKEDMDSWFYHLAIVSAGEHNAGTSYEHIVSRLMQAEAECAKTLDSHSLWKDPHLLYSKENISHPLTTLPNEYLRNEAIKLFKSVQLFISVPLDCTGIEYHVSLMQNSLQLCLSHSELQSELFFQLVKQTSPHAHHKLCGGSGVHQFLLCATQSIFTCDSTGTNSEKTSPTSNSVNFSQTVSSNSTNDKSNPSNHVFIQAFQFLSLAISLFVPKSRILWLLRQHLRRSADTKTDIGKYAIYCQRALERTLQNGPRNYRPSRMEVLSILLRNPYQHSLPHSIPVHFLNESYVVIGFDGSSTVSEFEKLLNSEIGIRDNSQSGFALYSDDPIDVNVEHLQHQTDKLSDIISKWEIVLREKHMGKFENTKVIKFIYKQRLSLRHFIKYETDKERLLLTYQINHDIINGLFPITEELAMELAVLIAQIEFGDFVNINRPINVLQQVIEKFYPKHYRDITSLKSLMDSIRDKWMELKGRTTTDCVRIYLNCARKWPLCGVKLFEAKSIKPIKTMNDNCLGIISNHKIWIAVDDESLLVLDYSNFQVIARYPFKKLMTFGGCRDDFMIVISTKIINADVDSGSGSGSGSFRNESIRSVRMLFTMPKSKIAEITLLIADYINSEASRLDAFNIIEKGSALSNEMSHNNLNNFSTMTSVLSRGGSLKVTTNSMHTKL